MNFAQFTITYSSQKINYRLIEAEKGPSTVTGTFAVEAVKTDTAKDEDDIFNALRKLGAWEYILCIRENCRRCWFMAIILRFTCYRRSRNGMQSLLNDAYKARKQENPSPTNEPLTIQQQEIPEQQKNAAGGH
jgi:hypothetical protein